MSPLGWQGAVKLQGVLPKAIVREKKIVPEAGKGC
jgi:hypothetical protein